MPSSHLVPTPALRRALATLRWYRRPAAASLAVLALLFAVRAAVPSGPPAVSVVVAVHDLEAGSTLGEGDLGVARLPAAGVPPSALRVLPPPGRTVALPIRAGEVLTDVRLVDVRLLGALGPDVVAVPLTLGEPPPTALVHAGDLVDVIAAGEAGATLIAARGARVLIAPDDARRSPLDSNGSSARATIVLGVSSATALTLARSAVVARLSLVLRSRPD